MSPTTHGAIVLVVTLIVLLSGAPVAFGLGAISIGFIMFFQGFDALHVVAETLYAGLHDFTLVSIPMFVMMGAAIGVYLAATVSHEAMFALGIVVTVASLAAVTLYAMRAKSSQLFPRKGFAVVARGASAAPEVPA